MTSKSIRDYINLIENAQRGNLVSKIEELGMIGRVEYMGSEYKMPYRATLQDKETGKVWYADFNDGKTAEDWLIDNLSSYEQWKKKATEKQLEETSPEAIAKINQITRR